jgi:hypothetical protein
MYPNQRPGMLVIQPTQPLNVRDLPKDIKRVFAC